MSNPPYIIRNYQSTDFDRFILLNNEAKNLEPTERYVSPQFITEHLSWPSYSPEQDLFVAEIALNIIGYMDITPEPAIERIILDCWVNPEHRRRGLATNLLGYVIHRTNELGVKIIHVNISQDNTVAKSTLSKLGFKYVRRFLELRLDMTKVRLHDFDRTALKFRHLQYGEADKLAQFQNRFFAGTWGYNPNTMETINYSLHLANHSPEDVILAYDGDKVVGYCWTEIPSVKEYVSVQRKGRVYMIGVDPDYRGMGVGRRVLLAGLAYLKSKGLQVTELTVDSNNKTACTLYQSISFEVWKSNLWYEKVLD
ncbi:GNAT family N-acetyltransferase [Chloroflexota bacterium]